MSNKIPCTVCVLTYNSAHSLEACLESVKDFAEIIINDGGSTDNTLEIATSYNCHIIKQDQQYKNSDQTIADFAGLRNQMLDSASYDWILKLDSDEQVSTDLLLEIKKLTQGPENILYNVNRQYLVAGQLIELASTYPNHQIHLFNKKLGARYVKKIHEKLRYGEAYILQEVVKAIYVGMPSYQEFKKKNLKYLNMQIGMKDNISFKGWFVWILLYHLRASLGYLFRLFLIQFKSGTKLPLKYELFQIYYNFLFTFKSIKLIKRLV